MVTAPERDETMPPPVLPERIPPPPGAVVIPPSPDEYVSLDGSVSPVQFQHPVFALFEALRRAL